ncbi:hypothetical protein [Massilia yuzhufengensis]|uniref:hypothetical protein n=1 Tax=Massilia yuzhufengensis TaxID=1164594 RepID=UPI0011603D76|nr:hypothetical protein [Massilia yuzhufengensis]
MGSWINGVPASSAIENAARAALEKNWASASAAAVSSGFTIGPYTNVLGWTPTYAYTPGASFEAVKSRNLAASGAGKVAIDGATLDATSSFGVLRSGLAWNRFTNKYAASITLTNNSGAALTGPFQLALNGLPAGVTLDNASGVLNGCLTSPSRKEASRLAPRSPSRLRTAARASWRSATPIPSTSAFSETRITPCAT